MADQTLALKIQLAVAGTLDRLRRDLLGVGSDSRKSAKDVDFLKGQMIALATVEIGKRIFDALNLSLAKGYDLLVGQNEQLKSSQLASAATLAGSYKVTDALGGEIKGREKILALTGASAAQQRDLEKLSLDLVGVTSRDLQGALSTVNALTSQTGFNLKQNTEISAAFAASLGTYGVPLEQANQEIRSILSGQITSDSVLASSLGITNALVEKERERGTLFTFLLTKMQAAKDANALQAETISGFASNIQEVIEKLFRTLGEPVTVGLTETLGEFYKLLQDNKPALDAFAKEAGPELAATFKLALDSAKALGDTLGGVGGQGLVDFLSDLDDSFHLVDGAGRAAVITFGLIRIAFNGLALLTATLVTGLEQLAIRLSNPFDQAAAAASIGQLQSKLEAFARSIDSENRKIAESFRAAVEFDGDYTRTELGKRTKIEADAAEARRIAQEKLENDAKLTFQKSAQGRLEDYQRSDKKRQAQTQATDSIALASVQESVTRRQITETEAEGKRYEIRRKSTEQRIGELRRERDLTIAAMGDGSREVLVLDKAIADQRYAQAVADGKRLVDAEKQTATLKAEAQADKQGLGAVQGQLFQAEIEAAQATATASNQTLSTKIAIAQLNGNAVLAEGLERDLLLQQTAQLLEQTRLQAESNALAARMVQLQNDITIAKNNQEIAARIARDGQNADIKALAEMNSALGQINTVSGKIAESSAKNAESARLDAVAKKALSAQTAEAASQVIELYRAELVAEGKTTAEIDAQLRLLREKLRLATEGGDAAGKEADEYGRAADNAGRLADNQAKANASSSSDYSLKSGNKELKVEYVDSRNDSAGQATGSKPRFNIPDYVPTPVGLAGAEPIPGAATGAIVRPLSGGTIVNVGEGGGAETILPLTAEGLAPFALALARTPQFSNTVNVDQGAVVAELRALKTDLQRLAATAQPITVHGSENPARDASEIQRRQLQNMIRGANL